MTLDASKPADTDLVSSLGAVHRETRAEVNALIVSLLAAWTQTDVSVGVGITELEVGVDLTDVPLEVVDITAGAAETIDTISEGTDGHIKIFRFAGGNVSLDDGGGNIDLNQLPTGGTFTGAAGDILILCNVDGIPGAADGDWKEIHRFLKI